MVTAPKPHDEAARLEALQSTGLLDTAAEERFDRYTRLIKRLFDVPIALVSLVDSDRQWFKSKQGLDAAQTPRDIAFCSHAILSDEVFIVEDARCDERFDDNPLVAGDPNIRFYAGCPLSTNDGYRVGTLCIIDQEPKSLDKGEIDTLRDIAAMVSSELSALRLATIDELTQLSNRRAFNIISAQVLAFCNRSNQPASLVMIDLDRFKEINDTHGHRLGDQALQDFAAQLESSFRTSDLVARLGGDEFAVMMTNACDKEVVAGMERFATNLTAFNRSRSRPYELAFSSGAVGYDPRRHDNLFAMIEEADQMMYAQKKKRKQQELAATAS
ncbi:MAG: sensor domain-containing diguanylate cyclase [Gammaproteobacteria bacterium]|nr:sensor domain-containing diguanylate cyclase [Gammaproteobacteria bacterium]